MKKYPDLGNGKRWVRITPKGSKGFTLLLSKAKNAKQKEAIGNQSSGRVFISIHTYNTFRDFSLYKYRNIKII